MPSEPGSEQAVLQRLKQAVLKGNRNEIEELTRRALDAGADPQHILQEWLLPAINEVGDLFVSASTSETQGLTYMEAMRAGLPLLCRQDACLDGVVMQGSNGWQYTNENEFAACTEKFMQHPDCRERMRKSASVTGQRFSIEAFAQEIESAYVECLRARCWKAQGSA